MESFVDDVVENVDEGLFGQPVADLIELELKCCEAFGDGRAEGVWLLLVLLEGGDELLIESDYGMGVRFVGGEIEAELRNIGFV